MPGICQPEVGSCGNYENAPWPANPAETKWPSRFGRAPTKGKASILDDSAAHSVSTLFLLLLESTGTLTTRPTPTLVDTLVQLCWILPQPPYHIRRRP